jgi:hypothetical protein
MEWTIQDLGAVGEFVAAIAVLVTLVYLAIQTRQSKEAVVRASRLNIMDQRVRNLWAESDSSFVAPLIAKAERNDPLDEEDLVRVRALMRAEFVRCRFIFHNDLMISSNSGTTFGSLIYYAKIFGLSASQMWIDYRENTQANTEFTEWIEANVTFEQKGAA